MRQLLKNARHIGPFYVPPSYRNGPEGRVRRSDALSIAIVRFGRGKAQFTAGEVLVATGGHRTLTDVNDCIQKLIKTEKVKIVTRGIYRLTGEV